MKRWKRWLFGSVTAKVTGAQPEDFLNLCAREGFSLSRMVREDPFTLMVQVTRRQYPRLCTLAQRAQCAVERQREQGIPFFLLRFRRRYAFVAGAVLCVLLLTVGSRVILTLDVSGNQNVTQREILSQLRLCGVQVGTFGPSVPIRAVENKIMQAIPELSFCAVNLHGTRAEILVRERTPVPQVRQQHLPTDIIASADGIITHIEPWAGDACFGEGDVVRRGEVLISGLMVLDPPPMVEADLGTALVHAEGKVLARTWYTQTAQIALTAQSKVYTGETLTRHSLTAQGRRMKFHQNGGIPYENYDIITQFKTWSLKGKRELPLIWETETIRAYTVRPVRLDPAAAEDLLRRTLRHGLEESMDEGTLLKADYTSQREGPVLTVTMLAECTEQIGRMKPRKLDLPEILGPGREPPAEEPENPIDTKERSP